MRFFTDHYFHIGHRHYTAGKPCQDHALSRSSGQIACGIVSDGCSTGGNTDVGARVLTFGTLQAIRDHAKASNGLLDTAAISITARQQQLIGMVQPILGLDHDDMLATCIYAYVTQQGALMHVQGDGIVAIKYRNGWIAMHRFDWAKNAPFYPSYDEKDAIEYIQNTKLHNGVVETAVMTHVSLLRRPDGKFEAEETSEIPFADGRNGHVLKIPAEDLVGVEFIVAFTDGVAQIGKLPNGDDLWDWREAVTEFLAFKTFAGDFAKRRMIRGIRDLQRIGNGLIDDISYAVIRIEEDTVERERAE